MGAKSNAWTTAANWGAGTEIPSGSGITVEVNLILKADLPVGTVTVTANGTTLNNADRRISSGGFDPNSDFDSSDGANCTNSGNNTNWLFASPAVRHGSMPTPALGAQGV